MLVISLITQIEEAAADVNIRNATGNVLSFETLFSAEGLSNLEKQHDGLICFLAFHPTSDEVIADYIRKGSLASDSGPKILVLFTLDSAARFPVQTSSASFRSWGEIEADLHPSYYMVREMFLPNRVPELPGILFLDRLSAPAECVYVKLSGLDGLDVLRRLRLVFSLAEEAFLKRAPYSSVSWVDSLASKLQGKEIPYARTGNSSPVEWLLRSYKFLMAHKGDLVSALNYFK